MIKKTFIHKAASTAFAFFIFLMYASPAMSDRAAKPAETKNLFMWAVDAGQAKIYLLGSIHILKPAFYPLPGEIEAAYTKSRQIVFEADLNEMNTPSMQQKILTLGLYPGEDTLMNSLSPPMQEKLRIRLPAGVLSRRLTLPNREITYGKFIS